MKLKVLAIALLFPSVSAFALNTVTFTGEVANSTCNVTVDGTEGDVYVQLPTVQASELASGAGAGGKDFSFTITGCSGASDVGMRLVPSAATSGGNLINIAPEDEKADNVSIQILSGGLTGTPLDFTEGEQFSSTTQLAATTGEATVTYGARYFFEGTGTPDAGKVEAQLQYALTYN